MKNNKFIKKIYYLYFNSIWSKILFLFIIALIVFYKSFSIEFLSENINHIVHAPDLLLDTHQTYFRPIYYASLMLDRAIWNTSAWGYHLTNFVLHFGNVALLFLIIKNLSDNVNLSLLMSILFLLHPIHSHSIFWLSGRTDMICGLFLFLAFYFYLKANSESKPVYLLFSILTYISSLLSKEMALSYFFIITICELFLFNFKNKRYVLSVLLFTLIFLVFRIINVKSEALINMSHHDINIIQLIKNYALYTGMLIIPGWYEQLYGIVWKYKIVLIILFYLIFALSLIFILLNNKVRKYYKILLGFFLIYLFSVLPASRLVMRWYLYIPSGFFIVFIGLFYYYFFKENKLYKKIFIIFTLIYILISFINLQRYQNVWIVASRIASATKPLVKQNIESTRANELNFLIVPGEYMEVPIFQFGFNDLINFWLNESFDFKKEYKINVGTFVSVAKSEDFKNGIKIETKEDSTYILKSLKENVYFTNILGIPYFKLIRTDQYSLRNPIFELKEFSKNEKGRINYIKLKLLKKVNFIDIISDHEVIKGGIS